MIDSSKIAVTSMVDAREAPDGDWRLAYAVNDGGTLQLRDLMLCNPTSGDSTFALMIAPVSVTPAPATVEQAYVIYLTEVTSGSSLIIDLNAAVSAGWNVWVYGSDSAINYHLSGVI